MIKTFIAFIMGFVKGRKSKETKVGGTSRYSNGYPRSG